MGYSESYSLDQDVREDVIVSRQILHDGCEVRRSKKKREESNSSCVSRLRLLRSSAIQTGCSVRNWTSVD